jgi:hypothetical protein
MMDTNYTRIVLILVFELPLANFQQPEDCLGIFNKF